MEARLDYAAVAPGAMKAMKGLQAYINTTDLEHSLLELVKLRASQINGCAYCVNLHSHDARTQGETEQRIYSLTVWREAPLYSERERAALPSRRSVIGDAGIGGAPHVADDGARAALEQREDEAEPPGIGEHAEGLRQLLPDSVVWEGRSHRSDACRVDLLDLAPIERDETMSLASHVPMIALSSRL